LKGAENAAIVAKELEKTGHRLNAVRLDSGDLLGLSKKVRQILDTHGLGYVKIFASGDLDEYVIEELVKKGAKIDSFGVGTELVTSRDDPALSGIYKLVAVNYRGQTILRAKTSTGKMTIPGTKQVYRRFDRKGMLLRDVIALANETPPRGTKPLLSEVMRDGHLITTLPSLDVIRAAAKNELASLPRKYHELRGSANPPVHLSRLLERLTKSLWRNAK
jgi:nicotinate phosphoribosyltransferase